MNTWIRRSLVAIAVGGVALPAAAGIASADESDLPETQSPLQGVDAGQATASTAVASLVDGLNGADRPNGADGLESELFQFDPSMVLGPAAGLLQNGPFA